MRFKGWPLFKPLWSLCVKKSMHTLSVLAVDLKRLWHSVRTSRNTFARQAKVLVNVRFGLPVTVGSR